MSKNTINLLPKEERVKSTVSNSSKALTTTTVIFFVVGLLVVIGGSLFVYSQKQEVEKLTQTKQELLSQVESYSTEEQQLILLKDRLSVANETFSANVAQNTFDLHEKLYELMPEGIRLSEQTIGEKDNLFTFQSDSAVLMKEYIEIVLNSPDFSYVEMNQLTYNPFLGYQVELLVQ